MPVQIRHAKKVYGGITAADLARHWGISPQAAEKRLAKPGVPKPMATIRTLTDDGQTVKEQKVWDPKAWGL